jgi:hypothetical protein
MQEHFRPGVHLAVCIVHLTPHRHFRDGHLIQIEFGEGSQTHQTFTRLFDEDRSVVLQATEYQILGYLAEQDDAMDLLHSCFLQPDFNPMRFSFVEPVHNDVQDDHDPYYYGHYVQNQNAGDFHRWHDFAGEQLLDDEVVDVEAMNENRIPPPQPIYNFAEIYQENLRRYDEEEEDNHRHHYHLRPQAMVRPFELQNNVIPYDSDDSDDSDDDSDDSDDAQG